MVGGPVQKPNRNSKNTQKVIKSLYTVKEANEVLPLVRSITKNIVEEFRELRERGRERRALEVENNPSNEEQIASIGSDVSEQSERVEEYIRELAELGLEARDLELGLIDFPTTIEGKPAYLSWRLGEESVEYWHLADRSFADRRPIEALQLQS